MLYNVHYSSNERENEKPNSPSNTPPQTDQYNPQPHNLTQLRIIHASSKVKYTTRQHTRLPRQPGLITIWSTPPNREKTHFHQPSPQTPLLLVLTVLAWSEPTPNRWDPDSYTFLTRNWQHQSTPYNAEDSASDAQHIELRHS